MQLTGRMRFAGWGTRRLPLALGKTLWLYRQTPSFSKCMTLNRYYKRYQKSLLNLLIKGQLNPCALDLISELEEMENVSK